MLTCPPLEHAGFQGRLEEIRLSSILSILEAERRTGTLVLRLPGERKARIQLRLGRVLRALLDGGEGPRHAELVYGLLADSDGSFDFRPSAVALGDDVRCSTAGLLLEGVRRLDEGPPGPSELPQDSLLARSVRVLLLGLAGAAGAVVGFGFFVLLAVRAVSCTGSPATTSSSTELHSPTS